MSEYIDLIGYAAGVMTVSSFIPQAVHTYKSKNVAGLSLMMYSFFNIGTIGWMIYGFLSASYPVLVVNCITFLFSFPVLIMILIYRHDHPQPHQPNLN